MNTRLLLVPVHATVCPTCETAEHVRLKRAEGVSWYVCTCTRCRMVACGTSAFGAVVAWNKGDMMQVLGRRHQRIARAVIIQRAEA